MALIKTIDPGLYRIPLTVSLSDSTHGKISAFELVTCRVRDSDGAEGVGYTYTVGRNGGAIADALRREIPELIEGREADDTEAIWHHVWWALHYGGRGGPPVLALSALDIALWDLEARRVNVPLFRLLGGYDARVPCYAGGIDLDLSVEALLQQTNDNLAKGYRAITSASWPPAAYRSQRAKTCAPSGSSKTILRLARCRIPNPMSPIAVASQPL